MRGQREFESAPHGRAGNGGDDGLGDGIHIGQQVGERRLARIVRLAQFADVRAAAEITTAADDHERAHVMVVVAFLEGIEHALQQALVD